jgi:hypothetical protein
VTTKQDVYHRPITEHGGSKYIRTIYPVDGVGEPIRVDVYCVLEAFAVTCPGLQQAAKKVLCGGLRNKGSITDDIKGAMDALFRALEMQEGREHRSEMQEHQERLGKLLECPPQGAD